MDDELHESTECTQAKVSESMDQVTGAYEFANLGAYTFPERQQLQL